jgi:muramoyltetrapeptide carboxypeptidase
MAHAKSAVKKWPALKKGDIVDVIAPGSPCDLENLEKGMLILRAWGLEARRAEPIFGRDVTCSNTDDERWQQLRYALTNRESRAVWCARGGYGSNRLVPMLAKLKPPRNVEPKLFIGFSDITSLHVFLNQKWRWPTVHGAMLDRMGRGLIPSEDLELARELYFGEKTKVVYRDLKPLNRAAEKSGRIRGPVTGGNLMTLQSTVGTLAPWSTAGRIVFLEEVDERGYRVDRLLEHLRQSGQFAKARALVLGPFIGGDEANGSNRVWPVVERFAGLLKIPVYSGVPAGHGVLQRPVPLETQAQLVYSPNLGGTLTIESGCQNDDSRR